MEPMKKEYIWGFYLLLIIILSIVGYFMAKDNKLEYALAGALVGILLSLLLWIVWGSKNSY
jgi:hypothetical protein